MKEITLTDERTTVLVDDEDYRNLNTYSWHKIRSLNTCYAGRTAKREEVEQGSPRIVRMHRQIMGVTMDRDTMVDHRNSNGLDNQKTNLRVSTQEQNNRNARKIKSTSSIYKGVCWDGVNKKWEATITFERRQHKIGRFTSEELAARAYNDKAKELFGEFANLNIIA